MHASGQSELSPGSDHYASMIRSLIWLSAGQRRLHLETRRVRVARRVDGLVALPCTASRGS